MVTKFNLLPSKRKFRDIPALAIDLLVILTLGLCTCQPSINLPSPTPIITPSGAGQATGAPPSPPTPGPNPSNPLATLPASAGARTLLTYDDLTNGSSTAPVDEAAFALPARAAMPAHVFEGRLELLGEADNGGFEKIRDLYGYSAAPERLHLPEFNFEFIQDGSYLIPVRQGLLITGHAYWNIILGPGRAWQEDGDQGYSRLTFPFTLVERNANCTHNGVMAFLFNGERVSNVRYQITQETCLYFKFDMWGQLAATYIPETIVNIAAIKANFAAEIANRLPVRPFSALATDFPDSGVNLDQFTRGITPQHLTTYGLVINGVDYTSSCETRYDPYAYCESMRLPTYSTSKSAFASLALMYLAQKYGPGIPDLLIKDYVPEYTSSPGDWSGVTFGDALDMATGNYRSAGYMADEDSDYMNAFFDAETYASRIGAAFNFPNGATPGKVWVYHTSDIFILTRAMNNYLVQQQGSQADIFNLVRDEIYFPLHLSAGAMTSLRTDNSPNGAPLGGYGLFWTQDDIAKIGLLLNNQNGIIQGKQVLNSAMLADAMQKNPRDHGLDTSGSPVFKYKSGFWAKQWDSSDSPGYSCTFWTPFMSGYGGITVVLMPNGSIYYYFSDNDEFSWYDAVNESDKLVPMCP
jgi:hypothetical protein